MFVNLVQWLLQGIIYLIILDAILSWFQGMDQFPRSLTHSLTEPLYAPIHAVLNPRVTGGIDLSPILLIVALQYISRALGS